MKRKYPKAIGRISAGQRPKSDKGQQYHHHTFSKPKQNKEIFSRVNDKLFTYNWVGVLSCRNKGEEIEANYRIEIRSRFDKDDKQ